MLRRCTAAALVASWSAIAHASPMEDPTEGGAVFSGPTHANASSIYLAPAALAISGRGQHLYVGGSLRLDSVGIDRDTVDLGDGSLEDGPSLSATTWSPGAALAYWRSVLKDRAVFGVSLHNPLSERFLDGDDGMQYFTLGGYQAQTVLSGAGAFKLADWFIIGLGVSIGYSRLRLEFQRDTALEAGRNADRGVLSDCGGAPCGAENPLAAETIKADVGTGGIGGLFETENIGVSTGLAVRVRPDWWTTLHLINPPGALVDIELRGTARVHDAPRDGGDLHTGRSQITYRTPNTVLLGVRGPVLPMWDLVLAGRWQNLSRHQFYDVRLYGGDFEEAGVPEWYPRYRAFRDVWQVSGGLEGREIGGVRYGGRLHLETGATTDGNTSPMQIEGFSAGAAGGAELRLGDSWVVQAGYDLTWFPTVDVEDSAFDPIGRLDCVDSDYDFNECRAAREGRATPTAAGSYRRVRHAITLALRYDWL
jgi:hypothetical protein